MGEPKEEDLCHNFSRKDLQVLCKKYGLPAQKSNSEMATSLILFLEKKNLCPRTMWDAPKTHPSPLGTSELQTGSNLNLADSRGTTSHIASSNSQCNNRDALQNDLRKGKGLAVYDKASQDLGILARLHKERDDSTCVPEMAISSVMSSSARAPTPTFKFDVYCEDGMQLCVDLNSTPSDWIEVLKAEVHISHHEHEPQSSHDEVQQFTSSKEKKGSLHKDPDEDITTGSIEDGSLLTQMVTGICKRADEPDETEGYVSSPGIVDKNILVKQCQTPAIPSLILESEIERQDRGRITSSGKDKTVPVSSDTNLSFSRTCNLSESSQSCGPKYSGTMEKVGPGKHIYEKPPSRRTNGHLDPVPKFRDLVASSSAELPLSPTTLDEGLKLHNDRVGTSTQLADQSLNTGAEERCGITHSVQLNRNTSDQGDLGTCSPNSLRHPSDLCAVNHKQDIEYGVSAISSKSSIQLPEQALLASRRRKRKGLYPRRRYESQGVRSPTNNIEEESCSVQCMVQAVKDSNLQCSSEIKVLRDDASAPLGSSDRSLGLEQNGADGCPLTCSDELDREIQIRQSETSEPRKRHSVRRTSEDADRREISEGHAFNESHGIHEENGQYDHNEVEDSCASIGTNVKNLKTSAGDVRASRRRSSRLSTK